nr:MAG TPA_asm: hypothetical protein [Caudoviricetes sp.]
MLYSSCYLPYFAISFRVDNIIVAPWNRVVNIFLIIFLNFFRFIVLTYTILML